jgi:hypothetical protein
MNLVGEAGDFCIFGTIKANCRHENPPLVENLQGDFLFFSSRLSLLSATYPSKKLKIDSFYASLFGADIFTPD